MESRHIAFIDELRSAASGLDVVADLLRILDESLLLDDQGKSCQIIGDDDDIEFLRAVFLAAQFVAHDSSRGKRK